MIAYNDKTLCCGCCGCAQICPQKCIKMEMDSEGFIYPVVGEGCTDCGLCNNVCPIENAQLEAPKTGYPDVYGVNHKDDVIRQKSSSGGVFSLLAEPVLRNKGIVFGCMMNEELRPVHIGVETMDDLEKLRGSKYLQSNIGDTFKDVRKAVDAGREVLFVGTPCQTAGLYRYMGNRVHEQLYIVDFICHGVPSERIFRDFIEKEERSRTGKIIDHKFRMKDHGWNQSGLQLGTESVFDNGTRKRRFPAFFDKFMNGFLDNVYLRPSCYHCKFKEIPKEYADLTLGDFWGVKNVAAKLDDKKGTSLMLINTVKGEELWNRVKENCNYEKVDFQRAIRRNKSLVASAAERQERGDFFRDYDRNGYSYVEKKYMSAGIWAVHKMNKVLKC